MSEIKLTIDEVIEHCERKVKSYDDSTNIDKVISKYGMEPNFVKEYLEHKQVAEWLKELKHLRGAMQRILTRLEEQEKQYIRRGGEYRTKGNITESRRNMSKASSYHYAIQVVTEEGGIE